MIKNKKNILVIGSNSAIAKAFIKRNAQEGVQFSLISRDRAKLEVFKNHMEVVSNAKFKIYSFDINQISEQNKILDEISISNENIDVVLIASGTLPDQEKCEKDLLECEFQLKNNFVSIACFLNLIAKTLKKQKNGTIAVISSVAGDRGRGSNFIYGAAKSALSTYLSGLRAKLFKFNIQVIDIKPGFVDTPMTESFKKGVLWASPEKIAKDIDRAIIQKKDFIYTPFFWKFIMLIIRSIPEKIFKRLSL